MGLSKLVPIFLVLVSCGALPQDSKLFSFPYTDFPFLNGLTRDLAMSETESKAFYSAFQELAQNEKEFRAAIKHGYDAVPWAQSAPCATTTSAVLEFAFKKAGMVERAMIFHNHEKFAPTHEVEKMLYRMGWEYFTLDKYQVQIGVGMLGGRFVFHGTPKHSGHIYTTLWMRDNEVMIGDNGGYNHAYRGKGWQAGTEGIWLPKGIKAELK